jgi:LacI family transcriptional regulator
VDEDRLPRPVRVTLADVARRAGVSRAAASYVINGKPGVGPSTRERVLAVASELGFRPNRLARGLRQGHSKAIGLLLADVSNPFYPEIAAGVLNAAKCLDYKVFLSHTGDESQQQASEAYALLDHRCDGLIFTTLTSADRHLLEQLMRHGVPFVQMVRRVPGIAADFVGIDDESGGRAAGEHLLMLGHRDVAMVLGPQQSSASRARAYGFSQALARRGITMPPHRQAESPLTREGGYRAARRLFSAAPGPQAVFCGNDVIALGVIDALMDAGLRVPGDVAVIGYDDMPFASSRLIALSTVRQPLHEMGAEAARRLIARIADPDALPAERIFPHQLVPRRTCGEDLSRSEPRPLAVRRGRGASAAAAMKAPARQQLSPSVPGQAAAPAAPSCPGSPRTAAPLCAPVLTSRRAEERGGTVQFIRAVDWDRAQVSLGGGYRGQYLYAGESCLIVATKVPPGAAGPPRHKHPVDQTYFIVQGEITIELGAKTEVAATRSAVFIPAGLPHHNWNDGDADEVHIEVLAPGVLPVTELVQFGDLPDTSAQPAFVQEADPALLTGRDFTLDWLVNRKKGAAHAAVYLAEVPAGKSVPPLHVHEFDQFYFVLQGTLSIEVGFARYDVPPGHLVVLPAQVPHRQWNEQDETEQHLTIIVPEPAALASEGGPRWDTVVGLQLAAEQAF